MFIEEDLVGIYFSCSDRDYYVICDYDVPSVGNYISVKSIDRSFKTGYLKERALHYLKNGDWKFLFHDNIISKHEFLQDLVKSGNKDNIKIVEEIYKTLKEK